MLRYLLLITLTACYVESAPPPEHPPQHGTVAVQQPQPTSQPIMQPQPSSQPIMQPQPGVAMPAQSNFGTVSLVPGFTPDPHVVSGQSGGQDRAQSRHGSCRGWIARNPDHFFDANGHFGNLRIIAYAQADTTLVVMRPDGSFACADDSEGHHPVVAGQFPAGRYAVWVGSYREGEVAPYRLGFTELGSVTAQSLAQTGGATPTGPSNFGTVTLTPGFTPDPHVASGVSGGALDARQMGAQCRGWISNTPDHILQATSGFRSLRIMARANSDTTLVIEGGGRVWCNDDGEGRNPVVTTQLPAGTYRIWIGSYRQGENARYTLGFTELDSVHTGNLPSP